MDWQAITVVLLVSLIQGGDCTEIISFTQSSEAVRSGESMDFNCQADADEAEWRIDGYPKYSSQPASGYTLGGSYDPTRNPRFILTLTMWGDYNNGKRVSCYAASTGQTGDSIIEHKYFRVAGRYAPPTMDITVKGGQDLNISWVEPFYYSNFPITGYTLEVENQTTGVVRTLVHNTLTLSYVYSLSEPVIGCHPLNFSVTVYSALGNETNHRQGIFPRAPVPLTLNVEQGFTSDFTPSLSITATFTDPCLHEDTEYSIRVYNHSEIVRETLSSSLNEEFILQLEVDQGLTVDESYTVVATGSNIAGSPQLTDFIRIELSLYGNGCNRNLSHPPNGRVQILEIQGILLAVYTCDDSSVDTIRWVCLANSIWSGPQSFCPSINCEKDLPSPPNGEVQVTSTQRGLVATYTCNNSTVITRECLANSSWSGPEPTCPSVSCDRHLSSPPNGRVNFTTTQSGLVATYTCDSDDHTVITRECLANSSWSGPEPTCPSVSCDRHLPTPNGRVNFTTTQSGLVATYTCDDDHTVLTRECLANSSWSGPEPTCPSVSCDRHLSTPNGRVNFTTTQSGLVATYTCDSDDHTVITRECLANSSWSGPEPTCPSVSCDRHLPTPNGRVNFTTTQSGLVATYTCDDDHTVITRECLANSSWSGPEPTCPSVSCDRHLSTPNGRVNFTTTQSGLVATYTCDDDRTVLTRECLANSSWSGPEPICPSVHCGTNLQAPLNIIINTPTGLVAVYRCDDGSVQNRTCLPNASWSEAAPICTKSSSFNTLVIVVLAVLLGGVTGLAGVVVIVAAIVIGCCVCRRRRNLRLPLQTSNDVKIKGKVAANGSSEGPALETVMDGELIDFVKVSDV